MYYRTTNNLTTHIAETVSGVLGLSDMEQPIEYVVRAVRLVPNQIVISDIQSWGVVLTRTVTHRLSSA